ncbi:hypothetical protein CLOSCI_01591 [[Clostridium] scindens ATCC 35704]|nr:hypothetical protein CLOSCI_01591 [[Clostridium] scindens ATCC 35704]
MMGHEANQRGINKYTEQKKESAKKLGILIESEKNTIQSAFL